MKSYRHYLKRILARLTMGTLVTLAVPLLVVALWLRFFGLPEVAKGPAFAVATGLLVYPQFAHLEHVEPRHTRQLKTGTHGGGGYFGKVGQWLREGF